MDSTFADEAANEGQKLSACWENWPKAARAYSELISDRGRDSHYLRAHGLKPNLISLIGDCAHLRVLDVGSGDGWLLDSIKPREGYACDVVDQPNISPDWTFRVQDVRSLSYPDKFFDVVVGSLLLVWLEDVDRAIAEMFRVTKPGGKMVLSLVHPYFYRTGSPDAKDNFVITRDLSRPFRVDDLRIGGIAGPLSYFYRPFPDYLNSCAEAGFRIHRVLDWFIDMEDYRERTLIGMDSEIRRTGKVPLYSFIECKKE
jgi:SAM-dependent methyltransferase